MVKLGAALSLASLLLQEQPMRPPHGGRVKEVTGEKTDLERAGGDPADRKLPSKSPGIMETGTATPSVLRCYK